MHIYIYAIRALWPLKWFSAELPLQFEVCVLMIFQQPEGPLVYTKSLPKGWRFFYFMSETHSLGLKFPAKGRPYYLPRRQLPLAYLHITSQKTAQQWYIYRSWRPRHRPTKRKVYSITWLIRCYMACSAALLKPKIVHINIQELRLNKVINLGFLAFLIGRL